MKIFDSLDFARLGEDHACAYLRQHGCKIIDRNYRTAEGEIDIVARCKDTLLFVEVKTRVSADYALPWEAVGFRKRNKIKKAAKQYIQERPVPGLEFRFDVISITLCDKTNAVIEWIQSAF